MARHLVPGPGERLWHLALTRLWSVRRRRVGARSVADHLPLKRPSSQAVFGLLVLLGLVGPTLALEPDDSTRAVAARFAHALDEPTDARRGTRPPAHGQLPARLARIHSASLAVGAGGPGEPACLAQRGRGAACAVDLEHDGARRLRFDTPASMNDDRPGAGASPQPVADQLVIQA
jgi:hypothetical protein